MTSYHDKKYIDLVNHIYENGVMKPNRTGVDTVGVFGYQMRFDLSDGTIPLLTTKKMHTRSIIHEILWYLQGSSNIKYLNDNGVTIWDEWTDDQGELGPVYGVQWRKWQKYNWIPGTGVGTVWEPDHYEVSSVDQIAQIVDKLKNNPLDRRLIVSAWNVAELPDMKLPPCHYSFQLNAVPTFGESYKLSLLINQRSCDVGLGVPFNIAQYAILLRMFCEVADMTPGELIWNGGDTHIYVNHINALDEQIKREPFPSPVFKFARKVDDIDDFKYDDFVIEGYESHPTIKMEVAV